jgi:putative toxin-antitoxin system antitoxin component (TIGR02293 family)
MAQSGKRIRSEKRTIIVGAQQSVRAGNNAQRGIGTQKNSSSGIHSGGLVMTGMAASASNSKLQSVHISRARRGITSVQMNRVVERSGFALSEWAKYLHLSERSIQRYFKDKKLFELPYAERIVEIETLFELGDSVFGDPENFRLWMHRPSFALGGVRPADLLDTSEGVRVVTSEVHRMEHGNLA